MQLGHKMRLGEFQEINIAILSPLQSIAWWNIVIAWFQNPHQWSIVYWLYDLNNPSTSDYPDMYKYKFMVIRPLPLWKYLSSLFLSLLRMMLTNLWIVDEGKTIKWGQNFDNLFVPATATPQVDVFCGQMKKSTSFCNLRGLLMFSKKKNKDS